MGDYEVLKSDVLIIGGGGAGVRAAIEADDHDADVCLASKGPIGRSGLTPMAYPSLQAAFATMDPRDNPDIHYQDIISEGRYLSDQNLARVLADESVQRALDLERFGVKFKKQDGKFFQVHHPGQTYPRNLFIMGGGYGLISGLNKALRRRSRVRILEDFCASHLLKDQGEVVGAFGLNLRDGRFYALCAKATVLACGGYEELWGNTDSPPDITGDGVSLGFQAGAHVIDLEMTQYYPAVVAYPESLKGVLIQYETFLAPQYLDFRLVNERGDEFLPEGPLPARDTLMRLMFTEIEEGRGTEHNAVYIDPGLSSKPPEEIHGLISELLEGPDRNLRRLGLDIRRDRIEVCPAVHHTLGGVRINERTETSIPGLFAAGENASNLHGANRVSGNALAETQVFGARAGKYASEHARGKGSTSLPAAKISEAIQDWRRFMDKKQGGVRPQIIRRELKSLMDRFMGPRRDRGGMEQALQGILDLRHRGLPRVEVPGGRVFNLDWRAAMELSMTLGLAELVVRSAMLREETRGHHFRSDFPEASETPRHTLAMRNDQGIEATHAPVTELHSTGPGVSEGPVRV